MKTKNHDKAHHGSTTGSATEIQQFGTVIGRPISLDHKVRAGSAEKLNQILADTMTMRDMYKKHHWQVSGPTFYQLHLLFDKHYGEQAELVDALAERIQTLGGIAIAMAHDVAETTPRFSCSACCRLTNSSSPKPVRPPTPQRRAATMLPITCWLATCCAGTSFRSGSCPNNSP